MSRSVSVSVLLLAGLTAQQHVVVPLAASSRDGTTSRAIAGMTDRYRQQVVVAAELLVALRGRTITALTFRRDGVGPALEPGAARLTLRMAESGLTLSDTSPRFADNLAGVSQQVFSGTVSLPAAPRLVHRDAATWSSPDVVSIVFDSPWRYVGGRLCIEVEGEAVAGNASAWWPVDAEWDLIQGRRTIVGSGCGFVAAQASHTATVAERDLRPDATARIVHLARLDVVTFAGLSATALQQPLDLAVVGAPGCWLQILPDVIVPAAVNGDPLGRGVGSAWLPLRIPNAPASLGACFFVQWYDFGTQGLAVSNAVKLEVAATNIVLPAAIVTSAAVASGPLPDSGNVEMGVMPVVRFTLQ